MKPDLSSGSQETGTYMAGFVIGFSIIFIPPLIGAISIFSRRSWARKYNLVILILLVCGLFCGGIISTVSATETDSVQAWLGFIGLAAPLVVLVGFLLFSEAAKAFPASYVSGIRALGPSVTESTLPPQNSPDHEVPDTGDVLELFKKIQDEFPGIEMTLQGPESAAPATLLIPDQPAVSRRILMDQQKNDILNLSIGPVWLTWEACDQGAVLDDFHHTVHGLLSGAYRFVEYRRDGEVIMANVLRPQDQEWVLVRQWSQGRWISKRGLQEEVVELVSRI